MTDLTSQWSERPPAARLHFVCLEPLHFGRRPRSVAVAHFCLVRPMIRIIIAVALLTCLSGCATSNSSVVQRRGDVTYHAADWSHSDMHGKVDVAPEPEGGMSALIARLEYPPELRARHITGVVRVRVSLDAAGHLRSAQVVQSAGPQLDGIAIRAVRETKWKPAMRAGKPVPFTFRFPITFAI